MTSFYIEDNIYIENKFCVKEKKMLKSYKYRIYPNSTQRVLIHKTFGCVRYIYNWGLEQKVKVYKQENKKLTCFDLSNLMVSLKKENEWLSEVSAQALQMSLRNLDCAFTKFFREKKGFPKFKSKHFSKKSFHNPQNTFVNFDKNKIKIQKLGWIKTKIDREFNGKIKTSTISINSSGQYFVSILVDDHKELPNKPVITENTSIGIDLGIKDFLITSDEEKVGNPKPLSKKLRQLKILQRRVSRKKKGGRNRKKAVKRLSRCHLEVSNIRKDFQHKLSTRLISENQTICLETLDVVEMLKNKRLARLISDVGWGNFVKFLEYKADWKGANILKIGRYEPSSKTCHVCGTIKNDLSLQDREWTCDNCKTVHDRDFNAAKNIKNMGLQKQNQNPNNYKNTVGVTGINACGEAPLGTRGNKKKDNNYTKS